MQRVKFVGGDEDYCFCRRASAYGFEKQPQGFGSARALIFSLIAMSMLGVSACSDFAPTDAQLNSPQYQKQIDCRSLSPQEAAALSVKDPGWQTEHPCWMVDSTGNN